MSKEYLSFQKLEGKLYGFSVYTDDMSLYEEMDYEMKETEDKRKTKYSFFKIKDNKEYSLGPRIRNLISPRYAKAISIL